MDQADSVSLAWTILITPLFSMPSYLPTSPGTMNYGSAVFLGGTLISLIYYWAWGRKNYHGPPAKEEEVTRRRSSMIVAH